MAALPGGAAGASAAEVEALQVRKGGIQGQLALVRLCKPATAISSAIEHGHG